MANIGKNGNGVKVTWKHRPQGPKFGASFSHQRTRPVKLVKSEPVAEPLRVTIAERLHAEAEDG